MRTTVELPDDLLMRAKQSALGAGISLKELFIEAIEEKLERRAPGIRREPPSVGNPRARRIGTLTPEQIDEAMFG